MVAFIFVFHVDMQASYTFNTVKLDSQSFDDCEYCTESFKEGLRVMSHTPWSFFLAPASCPFAT